MITASIVTYNTERKMLEKLIECVIASPIDTLYIIDNSDIDELKIIKKKSEKIKYIHNQRNIGFGSAHNIAIRESLKSKAKYHVIINPDIYWSDKVIEKLAYYMDLNPPCGLVMPKIIFPDGGIQYLCKLLPTPLDLIVRRFFPIRTYIERLNNRYELRMSGYDREMEVPSLSGCFMFIRCSVLDKTGGFDERYFLYAEDLDLCRRIGKISATVFYPEVSVVHEYARDSYKNNKMLKIHMKSIIQYFNKWGWIFDKERMMKNRKCIKEILRR